MKLKDIEKGLLEIVLSIKSFNLNVKVKFLNELPFEHVYNIWKGRVRYDPTLVMSDSLDNSFEIYGKEKCILLLIQSSEFLLILFLDNTKTKLFGYIQKKLESGNIPLA